MKTKSQLINPSQPHLNVGDITPFFVTVLSLLRDGGRCCIPLAVLTRVCSGGAPHS